jgi:RNA polymerase sigma-70 factor (ECF subfamily)
VATAFAHFGSGLRRYLLRRLRCANDADDLAQEVYLRLLRVSAADSVECPQAYVYRVAGNVLYEFALHRTRGVVTFDSEAADRAANHLADDAATPEESADQGAKERRLANVVAQLPPMQRAVLLLARHRDLSHAEIAARLGISVNTARVHLYRALAQCRQKMANE